jgi:hypothetical protein
LVPKRDLEVKHFLAVALEAEVTRFNDARVHGADGHLVNLLSFDTVEIGDADLDRFPGRPVPGILARTPRGVISNGLKPGVALEPNAELFGDFPLEEVDLRASGGEGGERIHIRVSSENPEAGTNIVREHGPKIDGALYRRPEEG